MGGISHGSVHLISLCSKLDGSITSNYISVVIFVFFGFDFLDSEGSLVRFVEDFPYPVLISVKNEDGQRIRIRVLMHFTTIRLTISFSSFDATSSYFDVAS